MALATLTASTASAETLCISCQYVAGARSWVPYIEEPGNISSNKGSSAEAQRPRELKHVEAIPCDFRFTCHEDPQVLTQAWALKLPNVPTWLGCPILISLAHHRMVLVYGNGATGQECFAMLSPVQIAPCRWEPAKKERVKTKGRTLESCRSAGEWLGMDKV